MCWWQKITLLLSGFFILSCATSQQRLLWYNSDPQFQNQATLNRDSAYCEEYSYQASMGMPTQVSPSGYDIRYNEMGNMNYSDFGGLGFGSSSSSGYGSIRPRKTMTDSLREVVLAVNKNDRKKGAFNNCMATKGWYLAAQNTSTTSYEQAQGSNPNYQWQTFFSDDFDDNVNNWVISEDYDHKLQIENGQYFFEYLGNKSFYSYMNFNQFSMTAGNFAIESDIQKISGVNDRRYGIFFGADVNNNYSFGIASNGHYAFFETKNGITSPIIKWKKSSVINKGTSVNKLFVTKNGNVARLFINKQYVDQVTNVFYAADTIIIGFVVDMKQKIALDFLKVAR